jgi:hypothetical protein
MDWLSRLFEMVRVQGRVDLRCFLVERFFRDLTAKRLRRGVFRDVEDLIMAIGDYIDHHNRSRCHPRY